MLNEKLYANKIIESRTSKDISNDVAYVTLILDIKLITILKKDSLRENYNIP